MKFDTHRCRRYRTHPPPSHTHTLTRPNISIVFLRQLFSSSVRLLAAGYICALSTHTQRIWFVSFSVVRKLPFLFDELNKRRWYQFVYTNLIGSVDSGVDDDARTHTLNIFKCLYLFRHRQQIADFWARRTSGQERETVYSWAFSWDLVYVVDLIRNDFQASLHHPDAAANKWRCWWWCWYDE